MINGKPTLAFRQRHLELIRKIEKSGSLKLREAMEIRAKLQHRYFK